MADLGALIRKRLIDHAYGSTSYMDESMVNILGWMVKCLQTAGPKVVDCWHSARVVRLLRCFLSSLRRRQAGLGGVLVDSDAAGALHCVVRVAT